MALTNVKEKKTDKTVSIDTEYYTWPTFKEGATFFLGAFDEGGKGYISLTFNDAYNFTYDAIKVFANPVNQYVKDVEQLRGNACKDIVIDDDFIHGTVTCDTDSLLEISVPYSKGWAAYVDGKRVELLKSNLLYCALELSPGTHSIEMKYCTPYLKIGTGASLLTLIGLVIYYLKIRKVRK